MLDATSSPVLVVDHLTVRFDVSRQWFWRLFSREQRRIVHALEDVSFAVDEGTTFALVGESGCGKSTVARTICGIQPPTAGSVRFRDSDLSQIRSRRASLEHRRDMQMIFQDPYSSLNPRWRVRRIVAEPIVTHRTITGRGAVSKHVEELLTCVGLAPGDIRKYPHEFSGGQRQRISIARALATNPAFIVCDEPTSALDVSVQAQILNLMRSLQRRFKLTYLLISHNLAVVAHMADEIGVMYLGRLVERGEARQILEMPAHPYTRFLLDTVPDMENPGRPRSSIAGEVPSPLAPPPGCAFHPRCPFANDRCRSEIPQLKRFRNAWVACHGVEEGRIAVEAETARAAIRGVGV